MKPEISIIMPAIRTYNWDKIYDSIIKSTIRTFELIIVSPFPLTKKLENLSNVKYVKDYGSPMRANAIGALLCEGKLVFPTQADDAFFIEGALDKNIDYLYSLGDDIKNVIVCKYSESQGLSNKNYQPDDYYKLVNAYPVNRQYVPETWWIFNTPILYREFFEQFGNYDCTYEACPMGHADLAIRVQKAGGNVKLSPFPISDNDHLPGDTGDHGPIFIAQTYFDHPKFAAKYNQPIDKLETNIDKMNWKNAPSIWEKRFTLK